MQLVPQLPASPRTGALEPRPPPIVQRQLTAAQVTRELTLCLVYVCASEEATLTRSSVSRSAAAKHDRSAASLDARRSARPSARSCGRNCGSIACRQHSKAVEIYVMCAVARARGG
eukprot:4293404-Prymnesium_polylepis.3